MNGGHPRGDVPGVQICRRVAVAAPPEAIWPWLTETARLEQWLSDAVTGDPASALRLERLRVDGGPLVETARVLEVVDLERLAFEFRREHPDWESTTVLELSLRRTGEGSEVELFQEGFQRLALSACLTIWETYRRRWQAALEQLARCVVGA